MDGAIKVDGGKPMRLESYTKNCRQLMNAENRRNSLSQGWTYELVNQHQIICPENIHRVTLFRFYLHLGTHTHTHTQRQLIK